MTIGVHTIFLDADTMIRLDNGETRLAGRLRSGDCLVGGATVQASSVSRRAELTTVWYDDGFKHRVAVGQRTEAATRRGTRFDVASTAHVTLDSLTVTIVDDRGVEKVVTFLDSSASAASGGSETELAR
jgi:hypothetical protein